MTDILKITVENQDVNLPVTRKTLGDFISGLLGQPQTLEKKDEVAFTVDHAWLIHIVSLITQRVAQQNLAEPLTFEATIDYRGGLTRKVSTFPAFEHFSETQNVVCIGVKLDISLLIQFPGKNHAEKQQITVTLKTNEREKSIVDNLFAKNIITGQMNLEIRHTERTWADDMLNLISKEFELVQTHENKIKKFLRKIYVPITGALFPIFILAGTMISTFRSKMNNSIVDQIDNLSNIAQSNPDITNKKLNALLLFAKSQIDNQRFGFIPPLIASIGVGTFVVIIGSTLAAPIPSFILLSRASEKNKSDVEKKLNRNLLLTIGSAIVTVALAIVANYIYDKLK
ncbi:hypothetical protein [Burkholderia diffusa]|uniref:hypothetical protein n=1 Tax=Burkholderia diffusa TaxID=488732 RepID=UPI0015833CFF|nr:hypothetical protein [Burkholderia diffusa]